MTIAFISNFINHHQVYLADELHKITDGNFTFVEMIKMPDSFRKTGYPDLTSRPYVLQAWKDHDSLIKVEQLANTVDVLLVGFHEAIKYEIQRCRNTNKITFEVSERWFKRGIINLMSPKLIEWLFYYHTLFFKKNVYKLCCSAYTSTDMKQLHAFRNKCFKWGYFTRVDEYDINQLLSNRNISPFSFMWCGRFLNWKHPELPIMLAARLKKLGYNFEIDMYGDGIELNKMQKLAKKLDVNDVVNFLGSTPNSQILMAMKKHHIFLFTSDQNEGWGAVANEAMSNGCVLVGSDKIGSIPFLITDGENGCIFKTCDIESLVNKVVWLLDNPSEYQKLARNGYVTMRDTWAPRNAAKNLMILIDKLKHESDISITYGPCSTAYPI